MRSSFRSFNHALIRQSKNNLEEARVWLNQFTTDDWEIEVLDIPHALDTYVSVYIKEKSDYFLFKMRWDCE